MYWPYMLPVESQFRLMCEAAPCASRQARCSGWSRNKPCPPAARNSASMAPTKSRTQNAWSRRLRSRTSMLMGSPRAAVSNASARSRNIRSRAASMHALASARRSCTVVSSAMRRLPPATAPRVVRSPAMARKSAGAHAGSGGIGELGEGKRAMGGNERVARDDVLAAGAGQAHGVPIVVDAALAGAQEKKSRLRGFVRLWDHAAEELPLRVVAAAAKTSHAG